MSFRSQRLSSAPASSNSEGHLAFFGGRHGGVSPFRLLPSRYARLLVWPRRFRCFSKRGKSRGGIIIRFPRRRESDSLREWRRLQTSMGFQTLI